MPVQVTASWGNRTITKVATKGNTSLALASDGTVWAWGFGFFGQIGVGTTSSSSVPVQPTANWGNRTIIDIASGGSHSLALASDGTVWAWGQNSSGQLGNGSTTSSKVPVQTTAGWGNRTITSISGGNTSSHALASDGTVWAWGQNLNGQLGDGTTTSRNVPVQTTAGWGNRTIGRLVANNNSVVAVASDGSVWAWGLGTSGQLGDGNGTTTGTAVQTTASWGAHRTISQISANGSFVTALASDGSLWTWGDNTKGQLGNGTTTAANSPIRTGWKPASVAFASSPGTALVENSNGTVSATSPAHAAGAVTITVLTQFMDNSAGPSFAASTGFTYVASATTTTNGTTATSSTSGRSLPPTGSSMPSWMAALGAFALISGLGLVAYYRRKA